MVYRKTEWKQKHKESVLAKISRFNVTMRRKVNKSLRAKPRTWGQAYLDAYRKYIKLLDEESS